jgi:hypothetical protein
VSDAIHYGEEAFKVSKLRIAARRRRRRRRRNEERRGKPSERKVFWECLSGFVYLRSPGGHKKDIGVTCTIRRRSRRRREIERREK